MYCRQVLGRPGIAVAGHVTLDLSVEHEPLVERPKKNFSTVTSIAALVSLIFLYIFCCILYTTYRQSSKLPQVDIFGLLSQARIRFLLPFSSSHCLFRPVYFVYFVICNSRKTTHQPILAERNPDSSYNQREALISIRLT